MNGIRTIVGLGEILWDVFPDASRFGGAPSNFACSVSKLKRLRTRTLVASGVGRDELGKRALHELDRNGVDTTIVQQLDEPTGTVNVELDAHGQASYRFADNCAWDNLRWTDTLERVARETDAVCFGSLGQRSPESRDTIRKFLEVTPESCVRIFDVNLRPPFHTDEIIRASLAAADVLKLNDEELPYLSSLFGITGSEREQMDSLALKFTMDCVALTRGDSGAAIWHDGSFAETHGERIDVIDTVGAGDAFTAVLALGLLDDLPMDVVLNRAMSVAGFVCASQGATPDFPDHLRWFES